MIPLPQAVALSSAEHLRTRVAEAGRARAATTRGGEELLLAALLLPLAQGDLRAPARPVVWATDASPTGGGIARADISVKQARELYRLREKEGGYSKLEAPARRALREEGLLGLPCMDEELFSFPSLGGHRVCTPPSAAIQRRPWTQALPP